MRFGFRMPSFTKSIAARTSWKRVVRHSLGLKAPRGWGFLTSPRKALYNRVYNRTSFGLNSLARTGRRGTVQANSAQQAQESSSGTNITLSPASLMQVINSPNPIDKVVISKVGVALGIVSLGMNPLLGIVVVGGSWYWLTKLKKQPIYASRIALVRTKKLFKKDRSAEAIPILRDAVAQDAGNIETNYLLGTALYMNHEMNEAIEYLKKYYDHHVEDTDVRLLLAQSHSLLKHPSKVVELLNMFPEEHPNYLVALLLLGQSFYDLEEYEAAINTFKRAPLRKQNLDDYLLDVHYHLGLTYQKLGKRTLALKHLNKVYAYNTEYRDVSTLITALNPISTLKQDNEATGGVEKVTQQVSQSGEPS